MEQLKKKLVDYVLITSGRPVEEIQTKVDQLFLFFEREYLKDIVVVSTCWDCNGTKRVGGVTCLSCDGTGYWEREAALEDIDVKKMIQVLSEEINVRGEDHNYKVIDTVLRNKKGQLALREDK